MDDMEAARYACDIREVLENITDKEQFENLVQMWDCVMLLRMQYQTTTVRQTGQHRNCYKMLFQMN